MAFEVPLDELQKDKVLDANAILNEYFTPENIDLKTEINAPSEFTTLETIFEKKTFNNLINFSINGKHLHNFKIVPYIGARWIKFFKVNMVVNQRGSRKEVERILIAMKQLENATRTFAEKLTGLGKDK